MERPPIMKPYRGHFEVSCVHKVLNLCYDGRVAGLTEQPFLVQTRVKFVPTVDGDEGFDNDVLLNEEEAC